MAMLVGITFPFKEEDVGSNPAPSTMNTKIIDRQETIEYPDKCQHPNCDNIATSIAENRQIGVVAFYCDVHATQAVEAGNPEYGVCCPNCGCGFGVN